MVNLAVVETSGVDHPAHLHEGWIVMKAAEEVTQLLEANMDPEVPETPDIEPVAETETPQETPEAETPTEAELLAEARRRIAELEELLEQSAEPVDEVEALVKSAPEPLRKAMDELKAEAEAATAALRKEREDRADREAVAKAKTQFSHLTLDVETLAPALRRLEATEPGIAKAVTDALLAADAQNESANIFTEVGKTAAPAGDSPFARLDALAKATVAAGEAATYEQAMAKAAMDNPDLYHSYLTEKGN